MTEWIRFSRDNQFGFGVIEDEQVVSYKGDMFHSNEPDGEVISLADLTLECPVPRNALILGIWNNFDAVREKQNLPQPHHPWYFFKPPTCLLGPGREIQHPLTYTGPIIYEAELAIVIGKRTSDVSIEEAGEHIFGYTAINDVTAVKIIREEKGYEQWCRAKGFDTFGPCGPTIETGFVPADQVIRAIVNGEERQSYAVSDMIFSPLALVSFLSRCQTLRPGDVIACGTSLGARSMKDKDEIEIAIEGLAVLKNTFQSLS
jgi:2-keto-4-pentenoate hydratase/2-oxohepta-3-ene-1,7-dioic acid hydratase in catechol pathway